MVFGFLGIILLVLIYGPQLWIKYVLRKYHKPIDDMPGTGGELAQHLVERFELKGVKVERGQPDQDHYNHKTKTISLSPAVYDSKSLSAVAVAAHEVGHAIQFCRKEPISHLRTRYLGIAFFIRKLGSVLLVVLSVLAMVVKIPHLLLLAALVGVGSMLISVAMYAAILPEEFDASFNKALPILKEGYVPEPHLPAVRSVLKAAAFTYVAAALTEILNIWRWVRFLR